MEPQQIEFLVTGGGSGVTPTTMALVPTGKSVMLVEKGACLDGTLWVALSG